MKRTLTKFLCGLLALLICGCTDSNKVSRDELNKLQEQYIALENENKELEAEVDRLTVQINDIQKNLDVKPIQMNRVWGVSYIGLLENEMVRFIENQAELRALPFDDAPTINSIGEKTLVTVVLKASNGYYDDLDTVWYYVSIPVYDTPSDCYGWVKYSQTSDYTIENQKLLLDPISIRIGAIYSYSGPPDFNTLLLVESWLRAMARQRLLTLQPQRFTRTARKYPLQLILSTATTTSSSGI
jgi:hypothetical protein